MSNKVKPELKPTIKIDIENGDVTVAGKQEAQIGVSTEALNASVSTSVELDSNGEAKVNVAAEVGLDTDTFDAKVSTQYSRSLTGLQTIAADGELKLDTNTADVALRGKYFADSEGNETKRGELDVNTSVLDFSGHYQETQERNATQTTEIGAEAKLLKRVAVGGEIFYSVNKVTGEELSKAKVALVAGFDSKDFKILEPLKLEVEASAKMGLDEGTKPSALDPDVRIFDNAFNVGADVNGELGLSEDFIDLSVRGDVDVSAGIGHQALKGPDGETILSDISIDGAFNSSAGTTNFLEMTLADIRTRSGSWLSAKNLIASQVSSEQFSLGENDRSLIANKLIFAHDVVDEQYRECLLWEIYNAAENAQDDFINEVKEGWVCYQSEDKVHAFFEHPDGDKLYVNRETDQATYLRSDGTLFVMSTHDPQAQLFIQVELGSAAEVKFAITEHGVAVTAPDGRVVASNGDFIYSHDANGDFNLLTKTASGLVQHLSDNLDNHLEDSKPKVEALAVVDMMANLSNITQGSAYTWRINQLVNQVFRDVNTIAEADRLELEQRIMIKPENVMTDAIQKVEEVVDWAKEKSIELVDNETLEAIRGQLKDAVASAPEP